LKLLLKVESISVISIVLLFRFSGLLSRLNGS
jgi:hypothetical protein